MFHHLRSAKSQIHYPLGCSEKFLEIPRRTSDLQSAAWENYQTGGSKVDLAFHPSEVDKMSTRNFYQEVALALRQLNGSWNWNSSKVNVIDRMLRWNILMCVLSS